MKAFLPCRAGSQRVKFKNTRPFAGNQNGLLGLKLDQLIRCDEIDEIIVSTNDIAVIKVAESIKSSKISIDVRPDHLCDNSATTDSLIGYVAQLFSNEHILWTHVTCPFFDSKCYTKAINDYMFSLENGTHDSLMGVKRIQTFLWDKSGALYDRSELKWPFTQSIDPIFEIDSTVFILHSDLIKRYFDRVGKNPLLFENSSICSVDIDYPDDFDFAELLFIVMASRSSLK
jgi:CMP-N-acetylneuraminic acid synthetase